MEADSATPSGLKKRTMPASRTPIPLMLTGSKVIKVTMGTVIQ